jgi:adenylosuccinate synthase
LLRQKINTIKAHYNMDRLNKLGIKSIPEKYEGLFLSEGIIESFISDVTDMLNTITITSINLLKSFDTLIFEGAQGLLLDQGHEYFPYVTRSNTGMKNVSELISKLGYENEEIEIVYATRAYLTRHGAGPFSTELPEKPYPKIVDLTNVPNPYQGTLRYGLLDLDMLSKTIHDDLKSAGGLNCNVKLALTCLDQLDEEAKYVINSTSKVSPKQEFIEKVFEAVGFNEGYLSYGTTRNTICCK